VLPFDQGRSRYPVWLWRRGNAAATVGELVALRGSSGEKLLPTFYGVSQLVETQITMVAGRIWMR
jgi:hypothetical protein